MLIMALLIFLKMIYSQASLGTVNNMLYVRNSVTRNL